MKKTIALLAVIMGVLGTINAQNAFFLGDNYYHKKMVKAFSALKEHKLDKAAGYWRDMEEKAAKDKEIDATQPIKMQLYPVWQLSECMMMNIRDGRGKSKDCLLYDPWSAYLLLKKLSENTNDIRNANLFLLHKDIEIQVTDIKKSIEKNLIDSIRKESSEAAYDRLIQELFNYEDKTSLEKERELVAYGAIIQTDLVNECQRYMDKYQTLNSSHLTNIERRRDSLAFVQLDTTAIACQIYLSRYPDSRFTASVYRLLERYAFNELSPTVEACKEYVQLYPSAEYIEQVKTMQCEYAFRDAKKTNTFGAYRYFLSEYRNSEFVEEARNLMEQALMKRFFNSSVTIDDLYKYFSASNGANGVDDTRINSLYTNLLLLPTSSMVMDCDGLTGNVNISTNANETESEERLVFNRQGLLTSHYHSRSGRNETFYYEFDATNGFKIASKTDEGGNSISYSTKWNESGEISEIKGSDGSRIVYTDDPEYWKKASYYKGSNLVKTDYFGFRYRLEKSQRSGGITIVYEYNSDGDVKSMHKQRGSTIMETTTYEYSYDTDARAGRLWSTLWQYNNGNLLLMKHRKFTQTTNRVRSNAMNSYIMNE